MFECFSEKALKVIMLAQEEARRLGHNFVGTSQILIGIITEGSDAADIIKLKDVTLVKTQAEVEKFIGRGSGDVDVEIPFTHNAKKVLESAWKASDRHEHNYIGPIHILYGLVNIGECNAVKVFNNLDIDLKEFRHTLNNKLKALPPKPVLMAKSPTDYLVFNKKHFIAAVIGIIMLLIIWSVFIWFFF